MKLDRRNVQYQRIETQESDSKCSIAEDYELYREYYSGEHLPYLSLRSFPRSPLVFIVVTVIVLTTFMFYRSTTIVHEMVNQQTEEIPETSTTALFTMKTNSAMKSLGGSLSCDPAQLKPSATVPDDVNEVRPADIVSIAAMGDSITAALGSKDHENGSFINYFGNSFVTGTREDLSKHITLFNVFRQFNPNLKGGSVGEFGDETDFNVARNGRTAIDMPGQARQLVRRFKDAGLQKKWKLVTIFVGTNDIFNLSCFEPSQLTPHIPPKLYKSELEKAILILNNSLPNTIVSITSMWNSQLTIEASTLILNNERKACTDGVIKKRDEICTAYRNAAYEIQNEKKFESKQFTVVVQGFMDDIRDAFRNKSGSYDSSFYAEDLFHLSKYGNAILGKFLWNGLLEPVGKKKTKAELNDDDVPLKCPDKSVPYIRTVGNS